ncbi:hypothetical protein [Bacillus paranthracis]|uniref:hypothetical protein n=1 Tax=Bacillus paranthracis TaxID=2026186 RepID=UPI001E54871A|nr:hypothetical protein [Bacillus paranthracis]MCC2357685.1 hypothetical protein [Bacillus paranthracis]
MTSSSGQADHKEYIQNDVWQINEFSKKVDVHFNTVDRWFVRLENEGLHYVNRVQPTNKKVYDKLDLEIALYIKEYRDQKWGIDAIFSTLPKEFNLRPFPEGEEFESQLPEDPTALMKEIEDNIKSDMKQKIESQVRVEVEEKLGLYVEQIKEMQEKLIQQLPAPADKEADRQNRFNETITMHRVRVELEKEAAVEWSKKADAEKTKRVGIFFKIENTEKRMDFISDYVNSKFEQRLKEKFDK